MTHLPDMQVFTEPEQLRKALTQARSAGQRIGFVPTMGALHRGHLTLIEVAKAHNELVVCSIYVNPTQFNEQADFDKYPKDLERDQELLKAAGADVLFCPTDAVMYPKAPELTVSFGQKESLMEGRFRPGHFRGVGLVVSKLLHLVQPHSAYFGQKDLQQFSIIKQLVDELFFDVALVRVPTVREESGLAMSSRNQRLSAKAKTEAATIYKALQEARTLLLQGGSPEQARQAVEQQFEQHPIELEYAEVVEVDSLLPASSYSPTQELAICIAGYLEGVRLIDNIIV